MTPSILVAGIGNILLQDDGLGPQAIARLRALYEFGDELNCSTSVRQRSTLPTTSADATSWY
jgi:Ni,Fe-hydrogenase maturation factor